MIMTMLVIMMLITYTLRMPELTVLTIGDVVFSSSARYVPRGCTYFYFTFGLCFTVDLY
jgi:hypothetical protein